jgi:hypothetical protein
MNEPRLFIAARIAAAGFTRRLVDRDAVLLTLNGASIPAAWVALWFVLSNLLTME